MSYSWIITIDHIEGETLDSAVGVVGPSSSLHNWEKFPNAGEAFKMYDCDGDIYYSGRITGDYGGFEPLDDFGTPNAGCATIKYADGEGCWETL